MKKANLVQLSIILAAAVGAMERSWAATLYSTAVLNDKPVVYWNFDEADGNAVQQASLVPKPVTTENDLVPSAGTIRVSHASIGSELSKLGNAADLHGTNYFAGLALRAGKSELPGAYAVEFWMQAQGPNDAERQDYLMNIGDNAPGVIYDFKPDQLELFAGASRTDNGPTVSDGQWHHVLWVYYGDAIDGVADRVDAFLDGVNTPAIGNLYSKRLSVGQILVGAALTSGANGFEGRLDEVAIYDLSGLPDEGSVSSKVSDMVTSHMAAAKDSAPQTYASVVLADTPLLYWNFDETDGNALQKAPITFNPPDNNRNDLLPQYSAQRITHAAAGSGLQLGNAIDLDGQGSFFGTTGGLDVGRPNLPGPWAVEFWFQLKGEQKMRYFLNMGSAAVSYNSPAVIYGYFGSTIEVYGAGRSGTNGVGVIDQNWHHLLVVNYNSQPATGTNRVDFYIDNVAYPNVGGDFRKAVDFRDWVFFGAAVQNPDPTQSGSLNGRLDELAIYDLSGLTNASDVTSAVASLAASHYAAAFGGSSVGTITITEQPASVNAERGGSVTFSVAATVSGTTSPLSYQWQRNGVSINGATNATYSIPLVTINDVGTNAYRVRVSAGPVFKFSNAADLVVPEPPAAPPTPYAGQVLADSPLFYWNFDENVGPAQQKAPLTRVQPTAENDLLPTGTAENRVAHADLGDGLTKLGKALALDGTGFLRAENLRLAKRSLSGAYAFELWLQSNGGASEYLANFGAPGADNAPALIYGFNSTFLELYAGGPRTGTNGPSVADNQWHHLVWINYNSAPANSTNRVDAYLDGVAFTNVGGGYNRSVSLTSLNFGAALPSGVNGFTGGLDEFAVYDFDGLTPEQVLAKGASLATNHFAAARAGNGTYSSVVLADNPVLYYNFDEDSGSARQLAPVTLPPADNSANSLVSAGAGRVEHRVLNDGLNLGNAAELDGVSYFQAAALDSGGPGTLNPPWAVEFWMQVQGPNADTRQDYLLNFSGNNPAFIYDFKPEQLEMFAGVRTDNGPVVADSAWHHVLWVFYGDGTIGIADRADAYLDGTVISGIRDTFSHTLPVAGDLVVGAAQPGYNGFQGRLDEVAIYDWSTLSTEAAVTAKAEQLVASHLAASTAASPPSLAVSVSSGQVTLSWSGAGYVLQSTPRLDPGSAWTDLQAASPYVVSPAVTGNAFFRLIKR